MPIALVVNTVNAIITAAVLQQLAGVALPLGWLCVVLLVTAGRCTLWLRYRGAESRVVDFTQWSWGATCGSLLAGMCWGLGGIALFPIAPVPGQIFLIFVIGGMCTGSRQPVGMLHTQGWGADPSMTAQRRDFATELGSVNASFPPILFS